MVNKIVPTLNQSLERLRVIPGTRIKYGTAELKIKLWTSTAPQGSIQKSVLNQLELPLTYLEFSTCLSFVLKLCKSVQKFTLKVTISLGDEDTISLGLKVCQSIFLKAILKQLSLPRRNHFNVLGVPETGESCA